MRTTEGYVVETMDISFIRPSEEICPTGLAQLMQSITSTQVWTAPVPIDRASGIIMDGNHRFRAAQALGLSHLPCVLIDYNDPRVTVLDSKTGAPFNVSDIFNVVMNQQKLPYKSTTHRFSPVLPTTNIPLSDLMGRPKPCAIAQSLQPC